MLLCRLPVSRFPLLPSSIPLRVLSSMATQKDLTAGKKAAAVASVNDWIKDKQAVGIGSGSTIVFAVERIAERVKSEGLSLKCVPTSFQARQLILDHGLNLSTLEEVPELDIALDGADEVDPKLNAIKGGGGCQTQEKIVAAAAKVFIIIADDSKESEFLGQKWKKGLPIEVLSFAYKPVKLQIERAHGGVAELRLAKNKAGPVVTDNGNLILDWRFPEEQSRDWPQMARELAVIPGILETGIFSGMAKQAYFGAADGSVKIVNAQ